MDNSIRSSKSCKPYNLNFTMSATQNDIQYQLWSSLIKKTSDSLLQKQLRVMADSALLIDYYNQELSHRKNYDVNHNNTRDQTQDNLLASYLTMERDKEKQGRLSRNSMFRVNLSGDASSHPFLKNNRDGFNSPNNRVLFRKSPLAHHQSFNFIYSRELKDVQENCRPKTSKAMQSLVDELNKLKKYFTEYQSNEKRLNRNLESLEKQHENYLILKTQLQDADKTISKHNSELEELKKKIKSLNIEIDIKNAENTNHSSFHFKEGNIAHLTNFLDKKEKNTDNKINRAINIENNILSMLTAQVNDENTPNCQKCCNFTRKAKNHLIKLRESLQEQSEEIQILHKNYKQLLMKDISRIQESCAPRNWSSQKQTSLLSPLNEDQMPSSNTLQQNTQQ